MYAFTSRAPQGVHWAVIGSFAAAILLFSVSSAEGLPFVWAFQLTGILFGALGVYLLVRYALKVYAFEITQTDLVAADGQPVLDMTVTQAVGRKLTVAARISLRDIASVEVLSRNAVSAKKAAWKDLTVFRYDSAPVTPASCCIVVPGENAVLIIPPDPEMTRILTAAAQANQQ